MTETDDKTTTAQNNEQEKVKRVMEKLKKGKELKQALKEEYGPTKAKKD